MKRARTAKETRITNELGLLIGLLHHGTKQTDAFIMQNIFTDARDMAHKICAAARRIGAGR